MRRLIREPLAFRPRRTSALCAILTVRPSRVVQEGGICSKSITERAGVIHRDLIGRGQDVIVDARARKPEVVDCAYQFDDRCLANISLQDTHLAGVQCSACCAA